MPIALAASLLLAGSAANAQQTIAYTDGDDKVALIDNTTPNDPTTLAIASGTATQSGVIFGTGSVKKTGDGTLILSAMNTYTGETNVNAGTLEVVGAISHSAETLFVSGNNAILEVSGAGTVSNAEGFIGKSSGFTGLAKVSGGSWTNNDTLFVGFSGNGTLEASGTGAVSSANGSIGHNSGSTGLAQVSGGSWINDDTLSVGHTGNGTLEVSGTGSVSNTIGRIGRNLGSTGSAKISGGSWTNTGSLFVGHKGNGTLEVSGGQVAADSVIVANSGGSVGSVSLTGGTLTTGQLQEGDGAGTVNFDGGTLQLTGDQAALFAGFETGDVTLSGAGGMIDTQGFSVVSDYALSGDGGLAIEGPGSLTLTGANTYTGVTNVNDGSLDVEGSLTDDAVVASGARLGGSGSIAGNVTVQNGGTLAPGNSPGILTVGSLDLKSGAFTAMEINGLVPGMDHDQVVVNGTANLDGDLNLAFGGIDPVKGQSYTLFTATTINDDFDSISSYWFDREIAFETEITNDYIFKIIAIQSDFANAAGLTPELKQIASLLDDNFSDGGLIPIIDLLNLLPEEELLTAFEQISASELTVLENFTFANARLVSTRLKNRQRAVRQGVTGFSTAGFNLYDETGQQIRNSLLADTSQILPAGTQTQPLSFESGLSSYISGSGTTRDFDGDSQGAGYEDDSFAIILGADYRLDDNLAVGTYLAYNNTDADLDVSGSDADLDSYRVGFTGTYWNALTDASAEIQRSYYATAHLGFAHHEYDINRSAFGGVASGDTDAFEIDLGTAIGYEVDFDGVVLTTEFSLDYINLDMDGYTESGSDAPLTINDDRSESFYSTLSLRLDYSTEYRGIALLPYAHAGWRHEYLDDSNSVTARFASSPVGSFKAEGASVDRDSLVGGFGLGAQLQEGLIIQLGYYGEKSSDFESHSLLGSVNLKF